MSVVRENTENLRTAWGELGDEGGGCPISVLYEYGEVSLLHQGGGVNVPRLNNGITNLTGKDDVWGVAYDWPKELIEGNRFVFVFQLENLPDLILADENIVWRRSRDNAPLGRVTLSYVPRKSGKVTLRFLKDVDYHGEAEPQGSIQFGYCSNCLNMGPASAVDYPTYDKLDQLKVTKVEPLLTNRSFFSQPLLEPDLSPMQGQAYETMKLDILHETVEAYLPSYPHRLDRPSDEHVRNIIDTIPILEANGIDGFMIYHVTDELLDALAKSTLRRFIVQTCSAGEWWGPYGRDTHETRPMYAIGLECCNRLLDRMEDCHVYIWFPEIDGRQNDLLRSPKLRDHCETWSARSDGIRYDDTTDNEFWKEEVFAEANRRWKEDLIGKVNDPSRVTAIYQAGWAMSVLKFADAGCDMTVNKCIWRSSVNIAVASGRGVQKAHHLPHGFDYDPWSWMYRMNHHPDEWSQGLKAYLHAGCSFLFHEGTLFRRDSDGQIKPTETGQRYCQAARYARVHPSVGKQISKIACMHGHVGEFRCELSPMFVPQLRKEEQAGDWIKFRFGDFELLDVFFPGFGNYMSGNFERFMTGTPYGPTDIIPWNMSYEDMREYESVVVLGINGCTQEQFDTFQRYVEDGGKLVLAAGQLRGVGMEPRAYVDADIERLTGVAIDPVTNEFNVTQAEVVHEFSEGSKLVRHRLGKGEVCFFTTNTLTSLGMEVPRNLIQDLADKTRFATFEPFSDWVEYMANRKGQTISLCAFNHGQIGFPCGNGAKTDPWKGTVRVALDKLGLPSDSVVKRVEGGCHLVGVDFQLVDGELVFNGEIDRFCEWVIGPKDQLESDFFGKA